MPARTHHTWPVRSTIAALATVTVLGATGWASGQGGAVEPEGPPVTVEATCTTLERLVQELAGKGGLRLSVAPDLRSRTVLLAAHQRPLREVMRHLSAALECDWTGDGSGGFRLDETGAARTARLALEERLLRVLTAECDAHLGRVRRFVRQLEPFPPAGGREAVQELRARAAALPAGAERDEVEAEARAADQASDPRLRPLLEVAAGLSPEMRRRLFRGERLVLSGPLLGAERAGGPAVVVLTGLYSWQGWALQVQGTRGPGDPSPLRVVVPPVLDQAAGLRLGRALVETFPGGVELEDPGLSSARIRMAAFFTGSGLRTLPAWTLFSARTLPGMAWNVSRTSAGLNGSSAGPFSSWSCVGDAPWRGWYADQPGLGLSAGWSHYGRAARPFYTADARGGPPVAEVAALLAEHLHTHVGVTRDRWLRFRSPIGPLDQLQATDAVELREAFLPMLPGPGGPVIPVGGPSAPFTPEIARRAVRHLGLRPLAVLLHPDLGFCSGVRYLEWLQAGWAGWRLLDSVGATTRQALTGGTRLQVDRLPREDQERVRIFLVEAATMPGQLPLDVLLAPTDLFSLQLHLSAPVRGPDVFRGMVRTLELRQPGRDTPLLALPLRADWPTSVSERADRSQTGQVVAPPTGDEERRSGTRHRTTPVGDGRRWVRPAQPERTITLHPFRPFPFPD